MRWKVEFLFTLVALLIFGSGISTATCCPFCSAVSLTFTEEVEAADVAVFAKLVQVPTQAEIDKANSDFDAPQPPSTFEVVEILKNDQAKSAPVGFKFKTVYLGDKPLGTEFLITALEPPKLIWATPIAVNERVKKYVHDSLKLPKDGHERLVFFQDYLEDKDETLTRDAYDEFAKASFATLIEMKPKMKREQFVAGIKDRKTVSSRKRLYFSMLSVCGKPEDVPVLEQLLKSEEREDKTGLDAMISCYLTLKGSAGMPLIEEMFLKNKASPYPDTYSAVMALRLQGEEIKGLPRERIMEGLRHMLDRPDLADLVITDLARWKDWSVMDKLFTLFKTAPDENAWIRMPVINYFRSCPEPKAKEYLAEITRLDPESVKKADLFYPLGGASGGPASPSGNATVPDSAATSGRTPKKKPGETTNPGETVPKPAPPAIKPKEAQNTKSAASVQLGGPGPTAGAGRSFLDTPWYWLLAGGLGLVAFGFRRWTRHA